MKFAIKVNNSLYFEMIPLSYNWESVAWELDKATAGFDHFRNVSACTLHKWQSRRDKARPIVLGSPDGQTMFGRSVHTSLSAVWPCCKVTTDMQCFYSTAIYTPFTRVLLPPFTLKTHQHYVALVGTIIIRLNIYCAVKLAKWTDFGQNGTRSKVVK